MGGKVKDNKIPGPPTPPMCKHGKPFNPHRTCPECYEENKVIKGIVHPLIDEYWESKGQSNLYHIVYSAYHMGMRKDHEKEK